VKRVSLGLIGEVNLAVGIFPRNIPIEGKTSSHQT